MLTKEFMTAGRAVFTIEVPAVFEMQYGTKPHYTFKVQFKKGNDEWPDTYFVKLLTGPDNTKDFTYFGMLNADTGEVRITAKSPYKDDSIVVQLVRRVMQRVWENSLEGMEKAGFQLHHEGRCGRCGRVLTVPESVKTGIGPECAGRIRNKQ